MHDEGFAGLARAAASHLLRRLPAAGVREGLVVDLGCGSGVLARALTDAGYRVLGVDISPHLLAIARRRAPAARFVEASFLDAEIPPCDAVTAVGEVLGYALDPRAGREALPALFERVHAALRPGGLFVFDLATPGREGRRPRRAFTDGDGWTVLVEAAEDRERRELTRAITVFRRVDGSWRRSDERHRVLLHDPAEVLQALAHAGFEARRLRGYGRTRFRRGHAGFEAVRRGSPGSSGRGPGRSRCLTLSVSRTA